MKAKELFKDYPVAVIVGFLTLVLIGVVYFRSSALDDLREQLPAKDGQSRRLAMNVSNALKLESQVDQITDINKRIAARFTDRSDVANNQQYFYKLESETGVKLVDVKAVPIGLPTKKKGPTPLYIAIPFTVSLQGEYARVLNFIRKVESGNRLCRVTTATLTQLNKGSADPASPLLVSLTIEFIGTP